MTAGRNVWGITGEAVEGWSRVGVPEINPLSPKHLYMINKSKAADTGQNDSIDLPPPPPYFGFMVQILQVASS